MNTWLKTGLQIAVLSGGIFAIGAGVASAETPTTPPAGSVHHPITSSSPADPATSHQVPNVPSNGDDVGLSPAAPIAAASSIDLVALAQPIAPPSTVASPSEAPIQSITASAGGPLAYAGAPLWMLLSLAAGLLLAGAFGLLLARSRASVE